ncbi:oligosaccharide flippase family protein [Methylobacterium durans]|uniref:oligosaccharide flippase family protein n=1 Tax=Methylobacterium durans TaxID=2202825 RepID=UPI002AFFFBE9|nr:oligosaccharide flippase family protein [Methylobacterium durans]MEA1832103.1 oligosaccharide flippase family protein [Methylobacterium durans]
MRTGILLSLTRIWMSVCGLGITVAAVTYADPAGFGLFAIATSIGLLFCMVLGSGTHEGILARTIDPDEAHAFASVTGLVFAAILALLALASERWGARVMTLTFLAYAVNCVGWGATNAADALSIREGRASRILISNGVGDSVNLAVAVGGLAAGYDVYALALAKLGQSVAQYLAFNVAYGRPLLPSIRLRHVRRHAGSFAAYTLPRLSNWAESYAADIFIGALLSPVAAGQFRLAARFTAAFQAVILNSLNLVMIAETGRRTAAALKTAWILRTTPLAIVLVGFAATAFALVVSTSLVRFKGDLWIDSAMIVLWITAATPALVMNGAVIALLTGRQAHRRLADIQVSRLVGGTIGLIAGATIGTVASAAGRSLANLAVTTASLWIVMRRQSHARLLMSVLARQTIIAVILAIAGSLAAHAVPGGLAAPATVAALFGLLILLQGVLTFPQLRTILREATPFRPTAARQRRQFAR